MKRIKEYSLIVLDFDGTICNLKVDWKSLKEIICVEFNKDFDFAGWPLMKIVSFLKLEGTKSQNQKVYGLIKEFEQPRGTVDYGNVNSRLLKNLDNFYIVSNNLTSTIQFVLNELNLLNKCKWINGIENVEAVKPSPLALRKIIEITGNTNSNNYLYIGDSDVDAQFALNCKINFVNIKDIDE